MFLHIRDADVSSYTDIPKHRLGTLARSRSIWRHISKVYPPFLALQCARDIETCRNAFFRCFTDLAALGLASSEALY